jgi:hypothetical protein
MGVELGTSWSCAALHVYRYRGNIPAGADFEKAPLPRAGI